MTISKKKIDDLAQYYLQNGFDHSTDEIVEGMNISRKTFFNRYRSKENSVKLVLDAWYDNIWERFQEKAVQCNHAVEELVQYGYELHYIRHTERVFYQYAKTHNLLHHEDLPFVKILAGILHNGITHYQFKEELNEILYAKYVMNNIANFNYTDSESEEIIFYLLSPILTERTTILLKELEFVGFV